MMYVIKGHEANPASGESDCMFGAPFLMESGAAHSSGRTAMLNRACPSDEVAVHGTATMEVVLSN
jgi:hypothetical protein